MTGSPPPAHDLPAQTPPARHLPAPSFQPRSWRTRSRMPEAQHVRLAEQTERLGFAGPAAAAAWAPEVLDIGFGFGESLLAAARAWPGRRVLGVEVFSPGLLRAMDALADAGRNATAAAADVGGRVDADRARVLAGDVTELLPLLAPGSLLLVQGFHPDPWPKRRHAARRLYAPTVIARLAELLAPGGVLHLVTDDGSYAAGIRRGAAGIPSLAPWPDGPSAPTTKYGRRARAAGREVHDMSWRRA